MQLWKKNFLITLAVFTLLLSVGISALVNILFYEEYQREIQNIRTEKNTLLNLLSIEENSISAENLYYLGENLQSEGRYLKIESEYAEILEDTFPVSLNMREQPVFLIRHGETPYLIFRDVIYQEEQSWNFFYGKDIHVLYQAHRQRLIASWAVFLLLLTFTGIIQYLAMKKIYLPISQISHELRNPLTVIQGYAQYLRTGILTEEDRTFAEDQLIREAANLRKTADKLLIMGNLREGRIRSQNLPMDHLLKDIQKQYPSMKIENQILSIQGDETLLKCLLGNLIANALHYSDQVQLYTKNNQIMIWNGGPSIDKKTLQMLNRRKSPNANQIKGNGIGLQICRDILRLYKGKLQYHIPAQGGTEACITLPLSMITLKP